MSQHKFHIGGDEHALIIFCEYCGMIAYHTDDTRRERTDRQLKAKEACPRSPSSWSQLSIRDQRAGMIPYVVVQSSENFNP